MQKLFEKTAREVDPINNDFCRLLCKRHFVPDLQGPRINIGKNLIYTLPRVSVEKKRVYIAASKF